MASGYLDLTSRYWRMSAVGAAAVCTRRARTRPPYSFGAAFFLVLAAGALAGAGGRLRLRRALSFFWLMRRRIFMERRLSRLPMRSDYCFGASVSTARGLAVRDALANTTREDGVAVLDAHVAAHGDADVEHAEGHGATVGEARRARDLAGARLDV